MTTTDNPMNTNNAETHKNAAKRIVTYENGNYTVTLDLETGTKTRENNSDFFYADFPESFDLKICNRCNVGCPFCHENSTPDGDIGDILSPSFIDTLPAHTEIAIGGGNPLEHPDLLAFLVKCKQQRLVPSMTVNQKHFMGKRRFLSYLTQQRLVYGLGVSLVTPSDDFIAALQDFPNAVIHVINGIFTPEQLRAIQGNNLKILILGYKDFRRGKTLHASAAAGQQIDRLKDFLYKALPDIVDSGAFSVISFDNLAIRQLEPQRCMTQAEWDEFYMGDDGEATMFIDMVERKCAVSSTSDERFPLTDNISDMFAAVRKKQ